MIGVDPGDYEIQLMRSGQQVWHGPFSRPDRTPAPINVPPPVSTAGYDSLIVTPTTSGRRDLVHVELR